MEFGLPDGGEHGEYDCVGLMWWCSIFAMQDLLFGGTKPFDIVYT